MTQAADGSYLSSCYECLGPGALQVYQVSVDLENTVTHIAGTLAERDQWGGTKRVKGYEGI